MSGPGRPLTVMIVDDHPLVRSAVGRAVEGGGMLVVAEAATAEEALELAPRTTPDILLLDIALPGTSGIQVVRELAPRLPMTRIVMLTVSTADRDVADAMRYGASGYLTKDVTPEALARALQATQNGELAMPRRLAARLVARMSRRSMSVPEPDDLLAQALTARERDVHRLLAEGLTDRDIAVALTISHRTVETHVSSILHKLGAQNRTEAATRYRDEA